MADGNLANGQLACQIEVSSASHFDKNNGLITLLDASIARKDLRLAT